MNQPNIFDFATSELSQDAFLCWLISWCSKNTQHRLSDIAKDFIISIYNNHEESNLTSDLVQSVTKLIPQFKKMDVYFEALINNEKVSFIIEDKTWTSVHSNQLKRYEKAVREMNKGNPERKLIKIYYKTGYLYQDEEKECKEAGYTIIGSKWMFDFLDKYEVNNPIYQNYKDYLHNTFCLPFSQIEDKLVDNEGFKYFNEGYFQYEFMKRLIKKCPDYINNKYDIEFGANKSGSPWTQYCFAQFNNLYKEKYKNGDKRAGESIFEYLFYRIDNRKNPETENQGYYLRINQYANLGAEKEDLELKKNRLKMFRDIFESIDKKNLAIKFSTPSDIGKKESEVCILFFDNLTNTLQNVLNDLPLVHEQFVTLVRNRFGANS